MEQETNRFRAVADDGEEFIIIEYQRIRERSDLSGKASITRGVKRLALTDGATVVRIDPETFKILQSDKLIRKVR